MQRHLRNCSVFTLICPARSHLTCRRRSRPAARLHEAPISGLHRAHQESVRRYPFYWWFGNPTSYAMKPSVAVLPMSGWAANRAVVKSALERLER